MLKFFAKTTLFYSIWKYFSNRRRSIFNCLSLVLFGLLINYLYDDVAIFLQENHPEYASYALIAKTILLIGILFFVLYQLKPSHEQAKPNDDKTMPTIISSRESKNETQKTISPSVSKITGKKNWQSLSDRIIEDKLSSRRNES